MKKINLNQIRMESGAVEVDWQSADTLIPSETRDILLAIDGVEGVGLSGERRLCVYIRDIEVQRKLPKEIGGFHVHSRCTGEVVPL